MHALLEGFAGEDFLVGSVQIDGDGDGGRLEVAERRAAGFGRRTVVGGFGFLDFGFACARNDKLFLRCFQEDIAQQIPEHLYCLDFDSLVRGVHAAECRAK